MISQGGYAEIIAAVEKLGEKHAEHIAAYGEVSAVKVYMRARGVRVTERLRTKSRRHLFVFVANQPLVIL